ncbi:MAG: DNA replication/repair protein RecF [Clostridia bacterium]|nr:DNA replication/repair protein RecF [Clostridia bacterium]
MKIKRLYAENFRNIKECAIDFSPGVNLLYGNNAEGKTNAIEGIYLFSRGRSHRTSDDRDMIRFGADGFHLKIEYETAEGEETLEYSCFGRERVRRKNGYKISRISEMLGSFKSVLFYPDNLEIVKDGPEERRAFLNIAASQVYSYYLPMYTRFKEALEARNKLLKLSKEHYIDPSEIEAWSRSMAEYASYIYVMRIEYLKRLEVHAKRISLELSGGKDEISFEYKSDVAYNEDIKGEENEVFGVRTDIDREALMEKYVRILTSEIQRECAVGSSLYGIQRDDIIIKINGVSARSFASQGQKRSVVLCMKLAEGEVIREMFGEYPVFLFDDVLSELDEHRRRYLIDGMKDRQIIITSTDKDELSGCADSVILVKEGEYVPSHR